MALIRFADEHKAVKAVKDAEFLLEFQRRANDDFWTTIECFQTCYKTKFGVGKPIRIEFYAPLCEFDFNSKAQYENFKKMPEDLALLRNGHDELYCIKTCLRIGYYAQKMHGTEILKMKAEF